MNFYIKFKTYTLREGLRIIFSLMCINVFFVFDTSQGFAGVEASYLYTLSDFSGPVAYQWAGIHVDNEKDEIYVVDPSSRDVRIFNEHGMEVYRLRKVRLPLVTSLPSSPT